MRVSNVLLGAAVALMVGCGSSPTPDAGSSADSGSNVTRDGGQVGVFTVELNSSNSTSSLVGMVSDGPTPVLTQWTAQESSGDCTLYTPSTPHCSTPCGSSAACVATDTCQPYPKRQSVGVVLVAGVKVAGGATSFTMSLVANNYQPPASTNLAYPPFAEGDLVSVSADGGTYSPFAIEARGIAPLSLTNTPQVLLASSNLTLTWPKATAATSRVLVDLDISHHGGSKGKIECNTADDGSLAIDKSLIGALLDLGVAGFPTVSVTRSATGSAWIEPGRVDLLLNSKVDQAVTVPGVRSCTQGVDCGDGGTQCSDDCDGGYCKDDLTCG